MPVPEPRAPADNQPPPEPCRRHHRWMPACEACAAWHHWQRQRQGAR